MCPSLVGGSDAPLVFVCSVTGVVAPNYTIDGMKENEMDPDLRVSILPYIG